MTNYIPKVATAPVPVQRKGISDMQILSAVEALGIDVSNIHSIRIGFEGIEVTRIVPGRVDQRIIDIIPIIEGPA